MTPRGWRIADARRRHGWNQLFLANAIDKSPSWVDKVERGVRTCDNLTTLRRIAAVLRVDLHDLIAEPGDRLPGAPSMNIYRVGTPTGADPPTAGCPCCDEPRGGHHHSGCTILYTTLTGRPKTQEWDLVRAEDTARSDCGCAAVLVAARHPAGHRPACARATWVTPVDPPGDDHRGWSAAYCTPNPGGSADYRVTPGFSTWRDAAHYLDALTIADREHQPLGVWAQDTAEPAAILTTARTVRAARTTAGADQ